MDNTLEIAQTFNQRYEKKFIVSLSQVRKLVLEEKGEFMRLFEFDHLLNDSVYNIVDNVYFESPHLSSYHEHLSGKEERVKLRIRQYNPDGLPEGVTFFEVKEKRESKTFKSRILIRPDWLRPFLSTGQFPVTELRGMNAGLKKEKIQRTLDTIYHLVNEEKHLPMLRCSYQRYAFRLRDSKKVRLTMDRDIRFIRLAYAVYPKLPYALELGGDDVIIEVKISDPAYLHLVPQFERDFGNSVSVSKYCLGIFQTRDRYLLESKDSTMRSLGQYQKK